MSDQSEPVDDVLRDVRLAPEGASEERIEGVEEQMDCKLPRDVKAFLQRHDGGEGTIGPRKRPIELWSIERIRAECDAQEITRAVPGLVLFGSDGGSEGYGFLPRLERGRYGRISFIAAGAHEFESLGDSLDELLRALAADR
jgi:SMI1/KNR4 family protein SUKH-1